MSRYLMSTRVRHLMPDSTLFRRFIQPPIGVVCEVNFYGFTLLVGQLGGDSGF